MRTVNANGTDIAYWDSGGDGLAVVFSHGFLMDQSMFDPQVEALTPEFRVITWDERGFGKTDAPGPFSYWDSANDVIAILDDLGIEKAVLGGMSQGGFLSLRAALTAPDRVEGLVLIDTQSGTEDPAVRPGYDALRDTWMEHGPAPVQETVAGLILGPGDWPEWFEKWAVLDRKGFSHAYDCLVERDDITHHLGEITCPALIVHGTHDAAIPLEIGEQLRDGLGGPVTFVAVEGAPHAANLTHPEEVNQAILSFLRSL